jgi:hypothetical protein
MDTMADHKQSLDDIERFLAGLNYEVSLNLWQIVEDDFDLQQAVTHCVYDGSVVKKGKRWDYFKFMNQVKRCVLYEGSDGHGPNNVAKYKYKILTRLETLFTALKIDNSVSIFEFEFTENHPGYPVFWEFNFFIKSRGKRWIFCGESSD